MHVHLRNQSQGGDRKGDVRQDEKVDRGRSGQRQCGLASCSAKEREGRQIPIHSPVTTETKLSGQMLILEFSFLVKTSMCDV